MENYLIEHCAPTLASLKTANLFNYMYDSDAQLYAYIDELNQNLREKGVSVAVLRKYDHSALIYVYREKKLRADLAQKGVHTFLRYFGYEGFSADEAIAVLQTRFGKEGEFPHEIGILDLWKMQAETASAAVVGKCTAMNVKRFDYLLNLISVKKFINVFFIRERRLGSLQLLYRMKEKRYES